MSPALFSPSWRTDSDALQPPLWWPVYSSTVLVVYSGLWQPMVMDSGMPPAQWWCRMLFTFSLCFSPAAEDKQFKQQSTWLTLEMLTAVCAVLHSLTSWVQQYGAAARPSSSPASSLPDHRAFDWHFDDCLISIIFESFCTNKCLSPE